MKRRRDWVPSLFTIHVCSNGVVRKARPVKDCDPNRCVQGGAQMRRRAYWSIVWTALCLKRFMPVAGHDLAEP